MIGDNRAVSSALAYALVTVITVSLTAGLVIGADTLVTEQRQRAVQDQLDVVGQRLASTIMTVDRMAVLDGTTRASITRDFPRRAAGSQYRIQVTRETSHRGKIIVESHNSPAGVSVPVRLSGATLDTTQMNGGPIRVTYDPSSGMVVIERA